MKKILGLVLALVLAVGLISVTAPAAAEGYGSNGKFLAAIEPPAFGSVPIANREEIQKIGNDRNYPVNGKYHLTADIDLSDGAWVPIGIDSRSAFSGVFDGQGYIIRNLTITGDRQYVGLIGYASSDAQIKNVGFEGTNINTQSTFAGVVSGHGGSISNCYNIGTISVSSSGGTNSSVGGICGTNGTINNSYNMGTVSIERLISKSGWFIAYAGGICGYNGNISNCYNMSEVSAFVNSNYTGIWSLSVESFAGGICGRNNAGYFISNSYNAGSITANSLAVEKDSNMSYAGGICGYSADNAAVRNSYWYMDSKQTVNGTELAINEKKGLGHGVGQASPLTAEQMRQPFSFASWDFISVWAVKPGVNNGFPILRAFHEFPSSWAEAQVNRAAGLKLVPPQFNEKYTSNITRAEFCALAVALYETYTGEVIAERAEFSDDRGNIDIRKAAGLGIVSGSNAAGTTFSPDLTFNREMAAALLVNLLKTMNIELAKTATTFGDRAAMSSWAVEQIGQVQAAGLISGSSGKFSPKSGFTRESGIILMLNVWDYLNQ